MQSLSSGWARAESCAGDSASKQKLEVNCKDNFTLIFTLLPNSVKLIGLKKKTRNACTMDKGKISKFGIRQPAPWWFLPGQIFFGLVSS